MGFSAVHRATQAKLSKTNPRMAVPSPLRHVITHFSQAHSQLSSESVGPYCLQLHSRRTYQICAFTPALADASQPLTCQSMHCRAVGARAAHSSKASSCSPSSGMTRQVSSQTQQRQKSQIPVQPGSTGSLRIMQAGPNMKMMRFACRHIFWYAPCSFVGHILTADCCRLGCAALLGLLCTVLGLVACPAVATWACFDA